MTLAFVLGSPCGVALDLQKSLGDEPGLFEPTLVIGADSRFSSSDGSVHTDLGAKVWHLEPGLSGTFCGLVDSAERGLSAFKRRLSSSSERSIEFLAAEAGHAFDRAVPKSRRLGRNATAILIAVRTLEEMAIICMDSRTDFRPRISLQEEVIGEPAACAAFRQHLALRIAPRGTMPGPPPESGPRLEIVNGGAQLHGIAVAALRGAILDVGGTIGGPLQTAILNARGTETRTTLAGDPNNLGKSSSFPTVRLKAQEDEVRGVSGRDSRRILGMDRPDDADVVIDLDEGPDGLLYITRGGLIARRSTIPANA